MLKKWQFGGKPETGQNLSGEIFFVQNWMMNLISLFFSIQRVNKNILSKWCIKITIKAHQEP